VVVRFLRDTRKPLIISVLHPGNPLDPRPKTKDDDEEDEDDENQNEMLNRCLLSVIPPNRRKAIFFRQ
jgi:hypothetical protein